MDEPPLDFFLRVNFRVSLRIKYSDKIMDLLFINIDYMGRTKKARGSYRGGSYRWPSIVNLFKRRLTRLIPRLSERMLRRLLERCFALTDRPEDYTTLEHALIRLYVRYYRIATTSSSHLDYINEHLRQETFDMIIQSETRQYDHMLWTDAEQFADQYNRIQHPEEYLRTNAIQNPLQTPIRNNTIRNRVNQTIR